MRIRRHWLITIMILLIPGLLWSAENAQEQRPRAGGPAARPHVTSVSGGDIKVFALRYQQAEQLAVIIETLIPPSEATIAIDGRSQTLIVASPPDVMEHIERLVAALDAPTQAEPAARQVLYRIYMLELPSDHLGLRPFSLTVIGSAQLPPERVLKAGLGNQVQIERFSQVPTMNERWQFQIAGQAISNEAIKQLTDMIPDCQVMELEWEDDRPMMLTTRVAPLPKSLQEHVGKLLGDGVGIVGYWFGNLSVPGTVRAPIGPWVFDMSVDRSQREDEVELEITVVDESQRDPDKIWAILSNSIRGKIGQPTIIGYNRDNRGVQTMGALVIVPEEQ